MKKILLVVLLNLFSGDCLSTDLGQLGTIYPIREVNLIDAIKTRFQRLQDNGEWNKIKDEYKNEMENKVNLPIGVQLPTSTENQFHIYNPEIILGYDIKDNQGKVLFNKGTRINPLKMSPLQRSLCFIDGNDQEQIHWVMEYCRDDLKFKRILISGNPLDIMKKTKKRFYFDQRGVLVNQFKIKSVPASIRQKGFVLYVEHFSIH